MNRRSFLGALGGSSVCLAGCLGRGSAPAESGPSSTSGQTTDAPPSSTTYPGVDVPPCPEKVDSFTREDVRQFATQFERAYATRAFLRGRDSGRITSVTVSVQTETTEATRSGGGWEVHFEVVGPAYESESGHGDPGMYVASYFVDDRTVVRAKGVEAVDPRENGTSVSCPIG